MTRLVIGYFFSEADSKWVVGKNWNLDDRAVGHKIQMSNFLSCIPCMYLY